VCACFHQCDITFRQGLLNLTKMVTSSDHADRILLSNVVLSEVLDLHWDRPFIGNANLEVALQSFANILNLSELQHTINNYIR